MGGTNDDDDDDNDKIYNLTQILFTNPYYLLNHVSMNLCLLNDFYKEIKTTIVDDTTIIKFKESEKIIIDLYKKIEEIIENDII
jgi:energy-converting hydrogenase A subunit M